MVPPVPFRRTAAMLGGAELTRGCEMDKKVNRAAKAARAEANRARHILATASEPRGYRCTIERRPQGWPSVGDYVDESGCLYRVVERGGIVYANLHGGGEDFIYGVVEQADWDDVPEGADVWPARLHVDVTGKYLGGLP
jgi:hypothetical protein